MANGKHQEEQDRPPAFAFANVVVDPRAHRVMRDGRDVTIEPKAFAVLLQLLAHPGELIRRDDLLDAVWGHNFVTPSTLSRVIAHLRRAMADDSGEPRYIQTVHGLGYRFIASLVEENSARKEAQPAALSFVSPALVRLPQRADRLIGRDDDITELGHLLRDARLVTVVGAGGIGKTQAALEVARSMSTEFPDGVWLFDCTAQTDGSGLARWLAGLFDIRLTAGVDELMARLGSLLRTRHVLLVFDNCERIAVPLGAAIEVLLAASVDPRVLVTSQHRLNCAGETLYWLQPLEVPPLGEWGSVEDIARLSEVPSMKLLLTRTRACASGFALTEANAPAVAEICRRLDGVPLALEIAAARLRLLSAEQLHQRMDVHFLNIADGCPSWPERHQTLRALIDWSFALLSVRERSLLTGLSVFMGPCTLEGASAVGAAFGLDDEEVLSALGGLVDKSLLVVNATTVPPHYRLLDSVRLYALERLVDSGDEERVRDAHLEHFVHLSQRVDAEIRSANEQQWCHRVRQEWADLHAAFAYAMSRQDRVELALALSGNLCWYFRMGAEYGEAVRWLDQALSQASALTLPRAQALIACGIMQHQLQVHLRAQEMLREGIALAEQLGESSLAGAGHAVLAFEVATSGDIAGATACAATAQAIADVDGGAWLRSMSLLARGMAFALGERHAEAEACLDEAYGAVSGPGHGVYQQAYVLIYRALQRYYLGHMVGAAADWLATIEAFIELEDRHGVAGCVEGAAYLLCERGEPRRAARFLFAAAHVRELTATPLMPQWRKAQAAVEAVVHEALGPSFEVVQKDAVATRFSQIVGEAHAVLLEAANPLSEA
jgi:non-specific serine/threonine protein kinase